MGREEQGKANSKTSNNCDLKMPHRAHVKLSYASKLKIKWAQLSAFTGSLKLRIDAIKFKVKLIRKRPITVI